MSQVIDDATSAMNHAIDVASTFLDDIVPLGEFLDEQLAKAKEFENPETHEIYDFPIRPSSPRIEMHEIPDDYIVGEEIARELLACNNRDDI